MKTAEIKQYSSSYSAKKVDLLFTQKSQAQGTDLRNLSEAPAVNLLVLYAIYGKWQSTASAFKSPFFDFGQGEVINALQVFMNTVSNYISVNQKDTEKLLSDATQQAIELALDPKNAYEKIINSLEGPNVQVSELKGYQKYFRLYPEVWEAIIEKIGSAESISKSKLLNILNDLNPQYSAETITQLEKDLSVNIPVNLAHFNGKSTQPIQEKKGSFFDSIETAPRTNEAVSTPSNTSETPTLSINLAEISKTGILNEIYQTDSPSFNDLQKSTENNLNTQHQKVKIKSLTESISLNQKYLFINHLFGGDTVAYQLMLDDLAKTSSAEEAVALLTDKYASKNRWDLNPTNAQELMDLVMRLA
jgi:hypothetical protein